MDDPYEGLDNEERAYIDLHDAMMHLYKLKGKQTFQIASQLLAVSVTQTPNST
jgi:hypothetical protein